MGPPGVDPRRRQDKTVPDKLFGIRIGAKHNLGDPTTGTGGDIPVRRHTGVKTFLGTGIHYYFEPLHAYKAFPYIEKRKTRTDKYFETSFRLYLLPVIPASVRTINDLERISTFEVATIEWSDPAYTPSDRAARERAYYWAKDLCKIFSADIVVAPEVIEDYSRHEYRCTFRAGDHELTVDSITSKSVELSFRREVFAAKDDAIDAVITKLRAQQIRPYE